MTTPVHVTVTGAAGQIGYSLLFRIASGQLLGPDTPIVLRLLEIEPAMKALQGVVMELDDCAFPLLSDIEATSDLDHAFTNTSWALLVGSIPRKAGMERGDLLNVNGGIFKPQGRAIAANAASDVRILVVGNPCNTNCLIARSNAPEVPADRWFAMTRLDQNRAETQLAKKAGVPVSQVKNLAIWGNHSATQFPDFANATVGGAATPDVITDHEWLRGDFITTVQRRGAAIIEARGAHLRFPHHHRREGRLVGQGGLRHRRVRRRTDQGHHGRIDRRARRRSRARAGLVARPASRVSAQVRGRGRVCRP